MRTRQKQNRQSKSRQSLWRYFNWNWSQTANFIFWRFFSSHRETKYFSGGNARRMFWLYHPL